MLDIRIDVFAKQLSRPRVGVVLRSRLAADFVLGKVFFVGFFDRLVRVVLRICSYFTEKT